MANRSTSARSRASPKGVIVVLLVVTIIGFLVTNFFGRFMIKLGENMVSRVPVVRTIYGVLKQIFDAVLAQSEGAFREVILIEYPRKGIWVIGFVTSNTQGEIRRVMADEMVNVFLPTTPNPTSGFLLSSEPRHRRVIDGKA